MPVRLTRQLTVAHLAFFKDARQKTRKRVALPNGKRGEMKSAGQRSPHSLNKELRAVKAFLRWARKAHGVQLSRDEISEGLEGLEAKTERRDFLRPAQIKELLARASGTTRRRSSSREMSTTASASQARRRSSSRSPRSCASCS